MITMSLKVKALKSIGGLSSDVFDLGKILMFFITFVLIFTTIDLTIEDKGNI